MKIKSFSFYEGCNITSEEFYRKLSSGEPVTTSQPSPADVMKMWDQLLKEHDEVVHVPMSSALVSNVLLPCVTIASTGILSPGLIIITCRGFRSSGGTCISPPLIFKLAYCGRISINFSIDFLVLLMEISSSSFPIWKADSRQTTFFSSDCSRAA